jgi:hypothetical protein
MGRVEVGTDNLEIRLRSIGIVDLVRDLNPVVDFRSATQRASPP